MEYLMSHPEWLQEALADYEDDYILFDLPGQIELFSHIDVMVRLVKLLENMGYGMYFFFLSFFFLSSFLLFFGWGLSISDS
jgi:hypothetical protein